MPDNIGMAGVAGLTIMTAAEVPNLFSGLLPSLMTISTFGGGETLEHTKYWIRRGEVMATILAAAIGAGAALLAGSTLPLWATGIMVAYLLYQYEYALKKAAQGPSLDMRDGVKA